MKKNKAKWVHYGGGTALWRCGKYPSDDQYRNTLTGEVITIQGTTNAHFSMPSQINRCRDLFKIPGVDKRSLRTLGIETEDGNIKKTYLRGIKFAKLST